MNKKKYSNANFMLEVILEESQKEPEFILRDRQGNVCTIGTIDDVKSFLLEICDEFKVSVSKSSNDGK